MLPSALLTMRTRQRSRPRQLGGTVVAGPSHAPWSRVVVIKDPQGATFIASQFVAENKDLTA